MKKWVYFINLWRMLNYARRAFLPATTGFLAIVLHLTATVPARAQFFPLPPWYIYGGGNGSTWDGSSSSPDKVQLSVTLYAPPILGQYGTVVATGSADLLQIAPVTTYTLTLSASVSGGSAAALMVDGTGAITNTTISGGTWKRYTNSYTSGSPADPRVGRNLNVQLLLNQSGSLGTVTANFTNTQFQTLMARPKLSFRLAAPPAFQLLWSTNFYWYIPQQTTNLRTGSWEDITDAPIVQGDQLSVRAGLESRQRFFRLRQP